jgi:uncharacterized protein (DUF4415 family)
VAGHRRDEPRIIRSEDIPAEERERRFAESLERLSAMTDQVIDFSDIPETTPEQWARAIPNPFYHPTWESVALQLDLFVLDWFRQQRAGDDDAISLAINAALMDHIRRERAAKADE